MKKIIELYYNLKIDRILKIIDYSKYFVFFIMIIVFINKNLQNDTFYSIKVGELIKNNGIDFLDHFCFVKNLTYQYPHLLYDLLIYLVFDKFNFLGIYMSTVIFTFIIIVCLYKVNCMISNKYISFLITILEFFLLIPFFTARSQVVSFSLFILTYYFIEKFLKNSKLIYAIILLIIPILITNFHLAVFPFYFIIYLPYFAEYLVSIICLKKGKKLDYYKLTINYNPNIKKLFIIFLISIFTGFITPLKNYAYIHLLNLLKGNSLNIIEEHQPLVLIENIPYLLFLIFLISVMIFSKIKINLKDLFFFFGMTLLSFISFRQMSMSIVFNGFLLSKLLNQILINKHFNSYKIYFLKKCVFIPIFFVLIIFMIILTPNNINIIKNNSYVDEKQYPVDLVKYIKMNLNYFNSKFFNEYNFGSYLLFNDIPVFVDSRADLYLKEFNKYDGDDIFTDYANIFNNFDDIIKKYDFDYLIIYKESDLNILIKKAYNYEMLYEDDYFVLWRITKDINI